MEGRSGNSGNAGTFVLHVLLDFPCLHIYRARTGEPALSLNTLVPYVVRDVYDSGQFEIRRQGSTP